MGSIQEQDTQKITILSSGQEKEVVDVDSCLGREVVAWSRDILSYHRIRERKRRRRRQQQEKDDEKDGLSRHDALTADIRTGCGRAEETQDAREQEWTVSVRPPRTNQSQHGQRGSCQE